MFELKARLTDYKSDFQEIDVIKSAYLTLLKIMRSEDIVDFIKLNPYQENGKQLESNELLNRIWDENARLPKFYIASFLDFIEPFMVTRSYRFSEFVDGFVMKSNDGSPVNGIRLLRWINQYISKLFFAKDKYKLVLELMSLTSSSFIPNSKTQNLLISEDKTGQFAYQSFAFDKNYDIEVPYNSDSIGEKFFLSAPKNLGLDPFDKLIHITNSVTIENMLKRNIYEFRGKELFIEGKKFGFEKDLYEFCQEEGLNLKKFKIPNRNVVFITDNYFCPLRKRIVLFKGCSYGAPTFIRKVYYNKENTRSFSFLDHLIQTESEQNNLYGKLANKHTSLLQKLSPSVKIVYYPESDKVFINDDYLTKYMPAKILVKIIKIYKSTGRTSFSNKEFRDDPFIVSDQIYPQFEVRFSRLLKLINPYENFFQLKKEKKGEFTFFPKSKIKFEIIKYENIYK